MKKLKRYFITGLAVILPALISIYIFLFVFRITSNLTSPFFELLFFDILGLKRVKLLVQLVSFFATLLLICFIGYLARFFIGRRIISIIDEIFSKTPILKEVHFAIKQLFTRFIFEQKKYRGVVLIEFPRKGMQAIGFITSEITDREDKKLLIFVPTVPNPTSGYLVIVNETDVRRIDITVEDAFKMIFSGGILAPEQV